MKTRYVITHLQGRCVCALFYDNVCRELKVAEPENMTGRIYIGRVENVVKNLNCAFIEIEKGIKCYYSLEENKKHFFLNPKNTEKVCIGDSMLVQISREAFKTKPATATGKLSLTGEYVVLVSDGTGVSVSGKVKKHPHCLALKEKLEETFYKGKPLPAFGFILRTNTAEADSAPVLAEAKKLAEQFQEITGQAKYLKAVTKMYEPLPPVVEWLKNLRISDLDEIVTDDRGIYELAGQYAAEAVKEKLRLYEDELLPLYKLYSLETILSRTLNKKVWLKSGGYLVIEQTEALTAVDVNSGKMVKKKDSFLKTNLEAAEELVRQIGLRNLSGMIIVDFINLKEKAEEEQLVSALKKYIQQENTGIVYVDMTRLGLVELTRKKNGKTLRELFADGRKEEE